VLEGPEWARRRYQIEAGIEAAAAACPLWDEQCVTKGGWALTAALLSAPTEHFGWGPLLQLVEHAERYTDDEAVLEQQTRARALALAGRIWFWSRERVDPYVQVAVGLGGVEREVHAWDGNGAAAQASRTSSVPLYAVSFGVPVQVTDQVRIGATFAWSHWLTEPWQRCAVALGVCTLPNYSALDPNNGVFSIGVNVGVSFGSRL
jgi:opacity protein-like surface antigen